MEKELTYNNIYFEEEFINTLIELKVPQDYIDFWEIKFYPKKTGGVRACNGIVESMYLFVNAKGQDESILKFVKPTHINYFYFDSLYVRHDLEGKNEYDEYRYNLENELVATYRFFPNDEKGHFCNQYKNGKLDKQYVTNPSTIKPYDLQRMIDSGFITNFDVNEVGVDCFYVENDKSTIYYYIR